MARLNDVETHCTSVVAIVPPNPTFIDETLRGFVLHLSAHFQGFCRELYMECTQICVGTMPAGLQATAQLQFLAHLAIERGNPTHVNLRRDFDRFGFSLNLHTANPRWVTQLEHLSQWRNKAAHQAIKPVASGAPANLTLPIVQGWKTSCDGLATSLDGIMQKELLRIIGINPW